MHNTALETKRMCHLIKNKKKLFDSRIGWKNISLCVNQLPHVISELQLTEKVQSVRVILTN